jgi:cyclophilin family peptidyl-prolyl cis-trans isomerase/HEAT repeat protein
VKNLLALAALVAWGCASKPPVSQPPPPAAQAPADASVPSPTPPAALASLSLEDVEPVLVSLEDRRAFDEPILAAAAAAPEPAVRARAALAAGRIGDERAAKTLGRLLKDPSPEVRESAAFGSGILGDPAMTKALVPLLSDADDTVSARAAWSLGFLEQADGRAALLGALAESPAARRPALLFALWRFPTPEVAAALEPWASDSDTAIRSAALYALARRPQEVSLPTLTRCLGDPDTNAAALCARALGLLGKPASIEALGAALGDRRAAVLTASLTALQSVLQKNAGASPPAAKAARVASLASDANPNLALPALALLRFYSASDREAFRRLWAAASSGGGRRRQVALQAAVAAVPDQAASLLDPAMASADPFLRAAAASTLGALPAGEASARRAKLMADPEAVVRYKVLEGIETPEAIRAERPLIDAALADPDPAVRAAALDLAARGSGEFALLTEAVEASGTAPSPDVAISAIGTAEESPEKPGARAVVEAAYRSPSTLVSRLARRSLVRRFGADRATLPWRTYDTGKTPADYATLLKEARSGWTARVETAQGAFVIRMAGEEAPLTVMNFVSLAKKGYFDGAPIHRVVPGFVIQDGDPTGTGGGGPGYEIRDELSPLPYRTGTVGMALSGPDTGGSQWFVTQAPQPHLDGGYTVFGQILSGGDVVNRIEQDDRILRIVATAGAS